MKVFEAIKVPWPAALLVMTLAYCNAPELAADAKQRSVDVFNAITPQTTTPATVAPAAGTPIVTETWNCHGKIVDPLTPESVRAAGCTKELVTPAGTVPAPVAVTAERPGSGASLWEQGRLRFVAAAVAGGVFLFRRRRGKTQDGRVSSGHPKFKAAVTSATDQGEWTLPT